MDVIDGKYQFKDGPPGTTLNSSFMNSLMEEICYVIEQAGLQVLTKNTDTKTQLWESLQALGRPYDLIVSSQVVFNSMIERVGANHYQIKTQYKSIFVKNITGGYNTTSWLSDGDTWGYLDTNLCAHIDFEEGAYINDSGTSFYMHYNTDYGKFNNILIKGNGIATAIQYSHYNDAQYCIYTNCGVDSRESNVLVKHFYGNSATPENQNSSKFIGCYVVNDLTSGGACNAFYQLNNLVSCYIDSINVGTGFYGFRLCKAITNPIIGQFDSGAAPSFIFYDCRSVSNISIDNINNSSSTNLFFATYSITSVYIGNITSSSSITAFQNCSGVSSVFINHLISSGNNVFGFNTCSSLSAIEINEIAYTGVGALSAWGLYNCTSWSAITITTITVGGAGTAEAIHNSSYGAALKTAIAANSGNDWIDSVDAQITNKVSVPSVFT
jgi:hypothetical protein